MEQIDIKSAPGFNIWQTFTSPHYIPQSSSIYLIKFVQIHYRPFFRVAPYSIPFSVSNFRQFRKTMRIIRMLRLLRLAARHMDRQRDRLIDSDWFGLIRIGIYRCTSLLSHSTRYLLSRVSLNVCIHRSRSRRLSEGLSGCCEVKVFRPLGLPYLFSQ